MRARICSARAVRRRVTAARADPRAPLQVTRARRRRVLCRHITPAAPRARVPSLHPPGSRPKSSESDSNFYKTRGFDTSRISFRKRTQKTAGIQNQKDSKLQGLKSARILNRGRICAFPVLLYTGPSIVSATNSFVVTSHEVLPTVTASRR